MSRKNIRLMVNIASVLVLGIVLVIVSCKKAAPPQEPAKETTTKTETPPQAPAVQPAEAPKSVAAPEANVVEIPKPAAKPAGDMEPIAIVMPKPRFTGTPERITGITNLEKPLGRARDPFYAPKGTANISSKKTVTSSDSQPIIGELEMVTDGDKEATDSSYVELGPGVQQVTIDLGSPCNIYAIVIWHYHRQPRVYKDVIIQVADDADFITNVRTLFNADDDNSSGLGIGSDRSFVETSEGKLIDAKGAVARYVRCYSNGNSSNDMNNYIEVEVFGIPVK